MLSPESSLWPPNNLSADQSVDGFPKGAVEMGIDGVNHGRSERDFGTFCFSTF
jgi:hypothetical protein